MTLSIQQAIQQGQCMCGAVQFQSAGPWREVIACHCRECRQLSGHYWAATAVPANTLEITKDTGLTWFNSSNIAKRAFCNQCGSPLFYQHKDKDYIAISAGCVPETMELKLTSHVYVSEKGRYYDIDDGLPQQKSF